MKKSDKKLQSGEKKTQTCGKKMTKSYKLLKKSDRKSRTSEKQSQTCEKK